MWSSLWAWVSEHLVYLCLLHQGPRSLTDQLFCRPTKTSQGGTDVASFFGTSRGFGFTKKNELFVGRVAMLGFASELLGKLSTAASMWCWPQLALSLGLSNQSIWLVMTIFGSFSDTDRTRKRHVLHCLHFCTPIHGCC